MNPNRMIPPFLLRVIFVFTVFIAQPVFAANYPYVKIQNRQVVVDFDQDGQYTPYLVKGVGYSPYPIGRHPSDWGYPNLADPRPDNIFDDPAILNRDFSLLKTMKANTIRIWGGQNNTEPDGRFPNKLTRTTLDLADSYGIKVIAGFYVGPLGQLVCNGATVSYQTYVDVKNPAVRSDLKNRFAAYVTEFKNHPAILFWAIGNENNYSLDPNDASQANAWYSLVNEMAALVRQIEGAGYHPVAIVNGDLGFIGDANRGASDAQLPFIDIWGSNVYRGISFGTLFNEYQSKSTKPFWISEFGIDRWHTNDVYNSDNGFEDDTVQAQWAASLWDEIAANPLTTVGGTYLGYSDQWWMPSEWLCGDNSPQCNTTQNHFGFGPADTSCPRDGVPDWFPPVPDKFLNEEWWGIMSVSPNPAPFGPDIMTPQPVYNVLKSKFTPAGEVTKPDLLMTDVSVAAASVVPGGSVNLSNTIKNQGEADASSVVIYFHLSADQVYGGDDDFGFSETRTLNVPQNSSSSATTALTVRNDIPSGSYYVCAKADSNQAIPETNENNNALCSSSKIQVGDAADLVVIGLSGPSTAVIGGNPMTISAAVKNQGSTTVSSANVGIYLSSDNAITTSDSRISSISITNLAAQASKTLTNTISVPAAFKAQTYYLGTIADYNNAVPESNEANNSRVGNTVAAVPGADLIVTAVGNPATANRGSSITVSDTVRNQGNGKAPSFGVAVYLSKDAVITSSDKLLGFRSVSGLNAGVSNSGSATVTIPSTQAVGNYYIGVRTDYNNSCAEQNETNNARAGSLIRIQ